MIVRWTTHKRNLLSLGVFLLILFLTLGFIKIMGKMVHTKLPIYRAKKVYALETSGCRFRKVITLLLHFIILQGFLYLIIKHAEFDARVKGCNIIVFF